MFRPFLRSSQPFFRTFSASASSPVVRGVLPGGRPREGYVPYLIIGGGVGVCLGFAALAMSPKDDDTAEVEARSKRLAQLAAVQQDAKRAEAAVLPKAFSPTLKAYELLWYRDVGDNCRLFRFKMPSADDEFFLPVVSTLRAEANVGGSTYTRLYTPVTPNFSKGHFDILVRHQGGMMARVFWAMKPGDSMKFRRTSIEACYRANKYKHVVLVSCGVGLTPNLQLLREILNNPRDDTPVTLISAARTENDFIMHDELKRLAAKHSSQLNYVPIAAHPSPDWKGPAGRISTDFLRSVLPAERHGVHVYICGSDRLVEELAGVSRSLLTPWSGGRASQPGRSQHWKGTGRGILAQLDFPVSCVTAF